MLTLKELTEQERKMLDAIVKHGDHKGVAKAIGCAAGTSRVYTHNLYRRLGVKNMTLAAVWYVRQLHAKGSKK